MSQERLNQTGPRGRVRCFGFILAVVLLNAAALVATAADKTTSQSVEVKLQSICVVKTKAFFSLPTNDPDQLPESGTDVKLFIRVHDKRAIRSVGGLLISQAIDDTSVPLGWGVAFGRFTGAAGSTRIETDNYRGPLHLAPPPDAGILLTGFMLLFCSPADPIAFERGPSSATLTQRLGLPASNARSLRRIEGRVQLGLSQVKRTTFKNLPSLVGQPLDLGSESGIALKLLALDKTKVLMVATGAVARLGMMHFYDERGAELLAIESGSGNLGGSATGTSEITYSLYEEELPTSLEVTVFGLPDSVTVPFAFENVPLP